MGEDCYKGKCAECLYEINLPPDTIIDEVITCPDCGSDLVVIKLYKDSRKAEFRKIELQGEDRGE